MPTASTPPRPGRLRRRVRAALVAVFATALVGLAAGVAQAATAVYLGYGPSRSLNTSADGFVSPNVQTGAMRLRINGVVYTGYCIEYPNDLLDLVPYTDVPWSDVRSASAMPFVNWIIRNSYPNVSAATLGTRIGTPITTDEAAAATQAAIWFYTEADFAIAPGAQSSPAILALYAWLTDPSRNVGDFAEPPRASVAVAPPAASGAAGTLIGPFTVTTNAASMAVSATAPAVVVDAGGAPITTVSAGGQFFVQVPAGTPAGSATVTVAGDAPVGIGTVFLTPEGAAPRQEQVLAQVAVEPVSTTVAVEWTAASTTTTVTSTTVPPSSTTTATTAPTTSTTVAPTTTAPPTSTTLPPVSSSVLGTTTVPSGGGGTSIATTTTVASSNVGASLPRTGAGDAVRPLLLVALVLLLTGAGLVGVRFLPIPAPVRHRRR